MICCHTQKLDLVHKLTEDIFSVQRYIWILDNVYKGLLIKTVGSGAKCNYPIQNYDMRQGPSFVVKTIVKLHCFSITMET